MDIILKDIFIDNKPERYIPSEELIQAVEVAYALKRPLLISGEPGTGKTEFARWVANNLAKYGFDHEPLIYNTKSSSVAQDLFYHYDAVSHFRETNIGSENPNDNISKKTTIDFIELKAMGLAFAKAKGILQSKLYKNAFTQNSIRDTAIGSVVLIDEIDKAPRDFPNDLLNEIERYEFEIKEINKYIKLNEEEKKKILVIMTSNFEKNLPEPFLRRCIYFHIEFPSIENLRRIILNRLHLNEDELNNLNNRINEFFLIRENQNIQKKPSTSECIDWISIIKQNNLMGESLFNNGYIDRNSKLFRYMPVILKKKEDLQVFLN